MRLIYLDINRLLNRCTLLVVIILWTMMIPNAASANIATQASVDCVVCNGQATFSSNLNGEVNYQWYDDQGTLVLSEFNSIGESTVANLCPGVYNVQATNQVENEFQWFNITIPGASAGEYTEITVCNTDNTFNLTDQLLGNVILGGNWTSQTGAPIDDTFDPASDIPGIFIYTIDFAGCQIKNAINVTVNQNANPGLSETYLICETYDPFFLNEQLDDADFGGEWFDPDLNLFDGLYIPAQSQPGLYVYRIDTVEYCPAVFATLTILENVLPNPGEDGDVLVCPNTPVFDLTNYLNGNPDIGGTWFNTSNQTFDGQFDVATMPDGIYRYRVNGNTPCPNLSSFITIEFTDGIESGTADPIQECVAGQSINLFDGLSGTYTPNGLWTDPFNNEVDSILTTLTLVNGTYTYTVTAEGCSDVSTTVDVQAEFTPNAGDDATTEPCESLGTLDLNSLLSVDADGGGQWMEGGVDLPNSTISLYSGVRFFSYMVEGVVCPNDIASFSVITSAQPEQVNPVQEVFCSNHASVDLEGYFPGTSFTHYAVDAQGNQISVFNPAEGSLNGQLVIESGNNCTDRSAPLNLDVELLQFDSQAAIAMLCESEETIDLNEAFEDVQDWTLSTWTNNGQTVNNVIPIDIDTDGVYIYEYNHPLVCGTSILELDVEVVAAPNSGPDQQWIFCNSAGEVMLESLTAEINEAFWLEQTNLQPADQFDPVNGGMEFLYIVPGVDPCPADTAIWTMLVEFAPEFTIPEQDICPDINSVELYAPLIEGYDYDWSAELPIIAANNTEISLATSFIPTESSSYSITLMLDNGICQNEIQTEVVIHPYPELQVTGESVVCAEAPVQFLASGAQSYTWLVEGQLFDQSILEFTPAGSSAVVLTGTTDEGCVSSIDVPVTVNPLPNPSFDYTPTEGCLPLQVSFINTSNEPAGTQFIWTIGDETQYTYEPADIMLNESQFWDITVEAVSPEGCVNSVIEENAIQVYGFPLADFELSDTQLTDDEPILSITNESVDADSWLWTWSGEQSQDYDPVIDWGLFEVSSLQEICLRVENEFGCADSTCRDVELITTSSVFVPNSFTPDNDGINDVFSPVVKGIQDEGYVFRVFNRWGELIFESRDPLVGWLGESQNSGEYYAQDGVYTWRLEVLDRQTDEPETYSGHVTLIR